MSILYRGFTLMLFVLTLPLQLAIMILIAATDGLPAFFVQKRTGKGGKPFAMYKFRTMVRGAETQQEKLRTRNEADGPAFKIRNDPRFTQVGRFLSHTGMDELPQLWNVLRGEMALIGPRPLPVAEAAKLKPWMRKRHTILPGIISPWILNGYHKRTFTEWMKSDVEYVRSKSPAGDIRLFFRSAGYLLRLLTQEVSGSVYMSDILRTEA